MFGSRRQLFLSAPAILGALFVRPGLLADPRQEPTPPISPPRVVQPKNPPEPDAATRALLAEQDQEAIKKGCGETLRPRHATKDRSRKDGLNFCPFLASDEKSGRVERLAKQIKMLAKA